MFENKYLIINGLPHIWLFVFIIYFFFYLYEIIIIIN